METPADRQRHFAESLEQTRKCWHKGHELWQVVIGQVVPIHTMVQVKCFYCVITEIIPVLQIRKAQRTGILNLREVVCGVFLQRLPRWASIADLRDNGCAQTHDPVKTSPSNLFFVCRLDRINDNIVRLPCLAVLNASYNNLNYIRVNFFLTSLRVLNIGFNKLEKLEAAIGSVPPPIALKK